MLFFFSHCSKQFLNSSILMPFSASAVFCFPSFTSAKHFPWMNFSLGKQKESRSGWDRWIGRVGHGGHTILVKNCWTLSTVWAGTFINHHEIGKHVERVFKKNSLKLNAASHNNASWCTDTDGFLEHSPSGGSLYYKGPTLQRIILGFGGFPKDYCYYMILMIKPYKAWKKIKLILNIVISFF